MVEGQDGDNRHLLIRNREGDLAGFVEEIDEEAAHPHLDRVLDGGADSVNPVPTVDHQPVINGMATSSVAQVEKQSPTQAADHSPITPPTTAAQQRL